PREGPFPPRRAGAGDGEHVEREVHSDELRLRITPGERVEEEPSAAAEIDHANRIDAHGIQVSDEAGADFALEKGALLVAARRALEGTAYEPLVRTRRLSHGRRGSQRASRCDP